MAHEEKDMPRKEKTEGKKPKASAAPKVAVVKTLDGKEVEPRAAQTLNRLHLVVLAQHARRNSVEAEQLGGLLRTMAEAGPTHFAVADIESEAAKELAGAITAFAGGYKPGGDAALLWCPLEGAQKSWEEWKAQRASAMTPKPEAELAAETEAVREAQLKQLREANEKREAARQAREQKLGQAAGVLSKFVPQTVREDRKAEDEREAQQKAIADRLRPFVEGQARLEWDPQTKRPVALVHGDHRATIIADDFYDLAGSIPDEVAKAVAMAKKDTEAYKQAMKVLLGYVKCTCEGCGKTESVGKMRPGKVGQGKVGLVHEMTRLHVPAMNADGKELNTYRYGPRQGQSRKNAIAVCRTCGGIAKRTCTAASRSSMSVWTDNQDHALGLAFEVWYSGEADTTPRTVATATPDGKVEIFDQPVPESRKPTTSVSRTASGGRGIGEAASTGQSTHPARRDESFVEAPRGMPALKGAGLRDELIAKGIITKPAD
jgi:hypothetical protein